jgi:hypothetical protein
MEKMVILTKRIMTIVRNEEEKEMEREVKF